LDATRAADITAKPMVTGKGINFRLVLDRVLLTEFEFVLLGSLMQNLPELSSTNGGGQVVVQY
jgi:hypothetical protein